MIIQWVVGRGKKQWTWWTSSCYFSSICAISWPKRQFSYADFMRFARNLVIFMLIMLIICIFASFLLIFFGIKYICDILYVFCLSTLDWKMDFFSLSSKLFQIKPEHRTFLPNVYDMFCVRHKCNAFRENSFPGICKSVTKPVGTIMTHFNNIYFSILFQNITV